MPPPLLPCIKFCPLLSLLRVHVKPWYKFNLCKAPLCCSGNSGDAVEDGESLGFLLSLPASQFFPLKRQMPLLSCLFCLLPSPFSWSVLWKCPSPALFICPFLKPSKLSLLQRGYVKCMKNFSASLTQKENFKGEGLQGLDLQAPPSCLFPPLWCPSLFLKSALWKEYL